MLSVFSCVFFDALPYAPRLTCVDLPNAAAVAAVPGQVTRHADRVSPGGVGPSGVAWTVFRTSTSAVSRFEAAGLPKSTS